MQENENQQPTSQTQSSNPSVQSNVRGKTDKGWDYATVGVDDNGRKAHICNFCQKVIRGGGINRVKKHLACIPGEVIACKKVTPEVRFTMQGILNETSQKSKSKATGSSSTVHILDDDDEDEDDLEKRNVKGRSSNEGKRKATTNLHPFFSKGINDPSQPTIKSALQTKARLHDVDLSIAMWFYDALGYVYEGMYRARKGVKELFKRKKELYRVYTDIIDKRWDKMLRKSIHCVAYWLNPTFQYDHESFCGKVEVFQGVLDMVQKYYSGMEILDLTLALGKFCDNVGTFGRTSAITSRRSIRPDEWWKLFGADYPKLQKFAIRILSQTASSSGCERNWSVFERIHTKKRNRLEHQRLNDLVFVHYKLCLENRSKIDKISYDPIDYERIDKELESWVIEEAPEGELNYDDIENMLEEEEPVNQTQESQSSLVDEDENGGDDEFNLLSDRELDQFNTPMS